jgi:hypothetical protein
MTLDQATTRLAVEALATAEKAFAATASALAARAGLPTEPFRATGFPLPSQLVFFQDRNRLVVLVGLEESSSTVDSALVYGLAHAGDRDLVLVLPAGQQTATAARSTFLDRSIRIYTHDGHEATALVLPRRRAALDGLKEPHDRLRFRVHRLNGDQKAWVSELIGWAERNVDLTSAHRVNYLAWLCDGRRVLTIKKSGTGLDVVAGVSRSNPHPGDRPPVTALLAGAPDPALVTQMKTEIGACIDESLSEADKRHGANRLQSVLARYWAGLGFPGGGPLREFPARRADGTPGVIDFLQLDSLGVLHVMETKIGHDEFLVLRGLDYWMWANANRDLLARHFGAAIKAIHLDFVIGDPPKATRTGLGVLSPYSPAQLEALDPSITWEVHVMSSWTGPKRVRLPLGRRLVPESPLVIRRPEAPPYVSALHSHLVGTSGTPLVQRVYHPTASAGLHPGAHDAHDDLEARERLHKQVAHVRSSQAFALNVFGGMSPATVVKILGRLGHDVASADAPELEYVDPRDRLLERTRNRTQVDVVLRGRTAQGSRVVALVEVKLSETDFARCPAYQARPAAETDVCHQPGAFGSDAAACPVLRSPDPATPGRRYLEVLNLSTTARGADPGCTFRLGAYEPMRIVALGEALLADEEADQVTVAAFAPGAYRAIWRRWGEAKAALQNPRVPLRDLTLEDVMQDLDAERAAYLSARYLPLVPIKL